jgi:putative phosphoesterase
MDGQIIKILIFSDTHGYTRDIPYLWRAEEYDYLIYLGDGYEEVENIVIKKGLQDKFIAVTGNCDFAPSVSRQKLFEIGAVRIFITHGDIYNVKNDYLKIFSKARELNADIAMFGHTHYADHQVVEGIHLFNPGSILPRGRDFCSVGYLEIKDDKILVLDHLAF